MVGKFQVLDIPDLEITHKPTDVAGPGSRVLQYLGIDCDGKWE